MDTETPQSSGLRADIVSSPEDCRKLGALINRNFSLPEGADFLEDFPVWDERYSPEPLIRLGVFHGHQLVVSAGIRLAKLKAPKGPLTVALLGAVATDEKWRGKGLASQLVSFAIQWARERDAAAVLLWGSEYELYRRLGFELCGVQYRVALSGLELPACTAAVSEGWLPGIAALMAKRPSGLELGAEDTKWLAAHKNVRWYWTGSAEAPTSYLAYGRGVDLNGLIHEWGGQPDQLLQLLSHVRGLHPAAELMGTAEILQERGFKFDETKPEFVCMAAVLEPEKIFSAYYAGVPFSARQDSSGWILKSGEDTVSGLDSGDVARVLFGPPGQHVFMRDSLPLPLWLWGLDGV